MKVAVVACAVLACVRAAAIYPTTHLIRTPQFDSAIIKSDRLGGNFAYSHVEAPAYAAVSPVVQNILSPVGVSYSATPIQYSPAYPVFPAYQPAYAPAVISHAPVAPVAPIYPAAAPVAPFYPIGPVAPGATPIEDAAPAPEAPAPEAPVEEPSSDSVETAASSDDSVSIEAAA